MLVNRCSVGLAVIPIVEAYCVRSVSRKQAKTIRNRINSIDVKKYGKNGILEMMLHRLQAHVGDCSAKNARYRKHKTAPSNHSHSRFPAGVADHSLQQQARGAAQIQGPRQPTAPTAV